MNRIQILTNKHAFDKLPRTLVHTSNLIAYGHLNGKFTIVKNRMYGVTGSGFTSEELVSMFE